MSRFVLGGFALIALGAGACGGDTRPDPRPVTTADAVLAVYMEDNGRRSSGVPTLIAAVWPDGHAVWSADRRRGGPPYRAGSVDPRKVADLLGRLDRDGLFADDDLNRARFGPDASFHTLLVRSGGRQVRMQSWHELGERDGVVATSGGLTVTDRPRLAALRADRAEWLYYRMVWAETRRHVADLLPDDGRPVDGALVRVKPKEWAWRESAPGAK